MKSKELLLKHLALNDCKGYVTSDGRLYKAIIDALEEAINYTHCCTTFAGRQQELLEFPEYIAKEHYTLVNQIGKIHYWKNETEAKTTVQLYNDFKANDL